MSTHEHATPQPTAGAGDVAVAPLRPDPAPAVTP